MQMNLLLQTYCLWILSHADPWTYTAIDSAVGPDPLQESPLLEDESTYVLCRMPCHRDEYGAPTSSTIECLIKHRAKSCTELNDDWRPGIEALHEILF